MLQPPQSSILRAKFTDLWKSAQGGCSLCTAFFISHIVHEVRGPVTYALWGNKPQDVVWEAREQPGNIQGHQSSPNLRFTGFSRAVFSSQGKKEQKRLVWNKCEPLYSVHLLKTRWKHINLLQRAGYSGSHLKIWYSKLLFSRKERK